MEREACLHKSKGLDIQVGERALQHVQDSNLHAAIQAKRLPHTEQAQELTSMMLKRLLRAK